MENKTYTVLDNEIWEDENLSHTEFRVLSYLIRLYNSDYGYSFPTRETLVKKCKMNKDTLGKVLKSLEEKGYITRAINKTKTGRNNIYYIHKYLVIQNNNENSLEPQRELSTDNTTNISNDNVKSDTEPINKSTNEMLLFNSKKFDKKLDEAQRQELNGLDTDILKKAIADAETTGKYKTYNFAYLLGAYNKLKEAPEDKSKVTTKYHNTFNEHFRKYDDLEARLLKSQNKMSFSKNL